MASCWRSACLLAIGLRLLMSVSGLDVNSYLAQRQQILDDEANRFLGGGLTLDAAEQAANALLMEAKQREYDAAFDTLNFPPSMHFFQAKPLMLQSEVYQFIREMPKGGVLHIHDIAITPIDFLVQDASYRDGLYLCDPGNGDLVTFKYASSKPTDLSNCFWELVATRRVQEGAQQFDQWLRSLFTLYTDNPQETYPDINTVWSAFEKTLISASGIISYAPVFVDYFYQALQSFYDDNVQYVEIRTTIPEVYLFDGTLLNEIQVVGLYQEAFDSFLQDHLDFGGAKIIYAPLRRVDNGTMDRYIALASQLKALYPNVVAGFDLVGQEDLGPPLKDFLLQLLSGAADPELHYFFHAGETDWQGTTVDENLIDAILLNTSRIGHGFAIAKHPAVRELARSRGVPVEICPISNQVLALVADLRNHPASGLMADDFPLVISADDPASWEAIGVGSDIYMAFMGLAGRRADLRTLKQLALNSIMYSAMSPDEKNAVMSLWQTKWTQFIDSVYQKYQIRHNLVN